MPNKKTAKPILGTQADAIDLQISSLKTSVTPFCCELSLGESASLQKFSPELHDIVSDLVDYVGNNPTQVPANLDSANFIAANNSLRRFNLFQNALEPIVRMIMDTIITDGHILLAFVEAMYSIFEVMVANGNSSVKPLRDKIKAYFKKVNHHVAETRTLGAGQTTTIEVVTDTRLVNRGTTVIKIHKGIELTTSPVEVMPGNSYLLPAAYKTITVENVSQDTQAIFSVRLKTT